MAHVEHYKASDVSRLLNEWERNKKYRDREGRIDPTRTPDNYTMLQGDIQERLNSRLAAVPHSTRADLNVCSDWVVTCPQEITDPADQKRFFDLTWKFTQDRYGADNVLQGYVHLDETTPHIHMPVVPVTGGRISAKALFTRKELSDYHKQLDKAVEQEFGRQGLIINGRTKGNYTFRELRERTAKEQELTAREEKQDSREREYAKQAKAYNKAVDVYREKKAEQAAEAERLSLKARRLDNREQQLDAREAGLKAREAACDVREADTLRLSQEAVERLQKAEEQEKRNEERSKALDRREQLLGRQESAKQLHVPGGNSRKLPDIDFKY